MQNHLPSSRTDLRVEKIGGDDSFQLRKTLAMLTERYENGGKWIYVYSAFKNSIAENSSDRWNTTDILIEIAERISQKDEKIALEKAKELEEFYQERIETELSDHSEKEEVLSFLKEEFEKLNENK